jgi:hypothetical protein
VGHAAMRPLSWTLLSLGGAGGPGPGGLKALKDGWDPGGGMRKAGEGKGAEETGREEGGTEAGRDMGG